MPPKTTFTKQRVVDAACEVIASQGLESLSARTVAKELGASTAPIYSSFASIEELREAVIERARAHLRHYTRQRYTDKPFLNQGTGLVLFAREQPQLYRLLFLTPAVANSTIP